MGEKQEKKTATNVIIKIMAQFFELSRYIFAFYSIPRANCVICQWKLDTFLLLEPRFRVIFARHFICLAQKKREDGTTQIDI